MPLQVNGIYPGELTPTDVVGGCIAIYENAWPNWKETITAVEAECKNAEGVYWQQAETLDSGAYQNYRTNMMLGVDYFANIANNRLMQEIHNQFYTLLLATSIPYADHFNIHEPFWHEPYTMLKYSGGQHYKAHYDGGTHTGRCLSCVGYLNGDYEGGEIEFVNYKLKIKPQPGMLIIFPSNFAYKHIAHPVTKGTKYNLVTWLRDREIR